MESQIPFEKEASTSTQHHDDVFIKDVITSETNHVASSQPVKKATRQWAAWTRQEEESFFTALRQVGKNFEKITSRVQSKNKDQVRHYYYRLVRRMNKLLGPELSLDAKNSKDTNAAMLRWWSLLEKHSCKASKLHLKPRRFKMFLETLEHQLLKDRKKNIRKRSTATQGGNGSHPVKPPRQRRRSGTAPTTTTTTTTDAYKKWEKAAIAGVSLVADAAEHLERTALDKLADTVQDLQGGDKGSDPIPKTKSIIPPVPIFHQNILSSMKLKLQLFPVDETTRRALEMDNHNPHLELTLSTRKKISSVLEHMTRKWGSSTVAASGELKLVPYDVQTSNLSNSQKWNQDSLLTAGDVYALIGSPPVFRLRYGWFGKGEESNNGIGIGGSVGMGLSTLDWVDSLTNVSVGDLLSEVSHNAVGPTPCHQQISYSCDSFDAAIAAHINKNHDAKNNGFHSTTIQSSIYDAEETCDAFSFPKNNTDKPQMIPSPSLNQKSPEPEEPKECEFDENHIPPPKDLTSLTDMYWPESLGALDLDVASCRYHDTGDVILSDSLGLGGLNCSLDAFQSCSFFGLEKKDTTTLTTLGPPASSSQGEINENFEKQSTMAFLTHFPVAPIHHHSSSLFTRFFLSPKPKTLLIFATLSPSHFSSTSTIIPSSSSSSSLETFQEISLPEETPIQIAQEKLFIPPDTEISSEKPPRILRGSNIVLSKYARDAQIVSAEFVKSSVETDACPSDGSPEFALVGRSNVGKSSLLNSIVKRKKLALTSKKPGKTQCINHFRINDSWYLVDLPGYGYASAPHELKQDWNKFTKDYFLNRSTLVSVFLLIDASIPAKKIDLEYASWLGQNQVPMTIVFTKCDKRKKKKNGGKHPEENVQDFQDLISKYFDSVPPWIMTSSLTNQGRDEILLHMSQLRNYWLNH